jgi:hypothetical protein
MEQLIGDLCRAMLFVPRRQPALLSIRWARIPRDSSARIRRGSQQPHALHLPGAPRERRSKLSIFGGDYPTPDGTGIRDYIQVVGPDWPGPTWTRWNLPQAFG